MTVTTTRRDAGTFAIGHVDGTHGHDLIAVDQSPRRIDGENPIGVTIEGESDIEAALDHASSQDLGMGRSTLVIDVDAVRLCEEHLGLGAPGGEGLGGDAAGRTVGAVESDPQSREARPLEDPAEMIEVAGDPRRIVHDGPDPDTDGNIGGGGVIRGGQCGLHLGLDLVVELGATRRKELDAVVLEGIVRGRDHGRGDMVGLRQEGQGRRRQHAHERHVDSARGDSGGERGLDHRSGSAGVPTHQNRGTAEPASGGTTHRQGELGCQLRVGNAVDAIGSEAHRRRD